MIYIALLIGAALFMLLLLPVLTPWKPTFEHTRRTELEEERELLLSNVAELQAEKADAAVLTREKVRLTQVLSELDSLPPAPAPQAARSVLPLSLALLLGIAGLMVLGSFTFLKGWRYDGLPPAQATQLQQASKLPGLERTAERTKAPADYTAWGDAAWDAQNYGVAAKAYTQVLMKNREDAKALRRVGFYLLNDPKMAQDGLGFIQRGATVAPQDPEGQLLLGYALGMFGQFNEALKVLKNYQALAPGSREADSLIVEFQQRTGATVDGKLVFAQNCASCHGANAEGGKGPKLVGTASLKNTEALRNKVLGGGMAMPAFPQLAGAPLDALVKYLQGLE